MESFANKIQCVRDALQIGKEKKERILMSKVHLVGVTYNQINSRYSSANPKVYYFLTDLPLVVGDVCFVNCASGYQAVTVKREHIAANNSALPLDVKYKWILARMDVEQLDSIASEKQERFEKYQEKSEELKTLRKQMFARATKAKEISLYRQLSQEDEEMKRLLKEYDQIQEVLGESEDI